MNLSLYMFKVRFTPLRFTLGDTLHPELITRLIGQWTGLPRNYWEEQPKKEVWIKYQLIQILVRA